MDLKRQFLFDILPKNCICAEVGVWKGKFSQQILDCLNPGELYLIDPWQFEPSYPDSLYGGLQVENQEDMDQIYKSVKEKFDKNYNIKILRMDSIKANKYFSDEFFDFVYIDANHSYEFIKQDLELWFPKIKKDGYLTGDDYGVEGAWFLDGPKRAVDEFVEINKLNLFVKNNQFLIKKKVN